MFLVKIANVEYLVVRGGYKIKSDQIWTEGSGRFYGDGSWLGTIMGNFTNLSLEIAVENADQLSTLQNALVSGAINLQYYDTRTKTNRSGVYYRANYEVNLLGFYDEGSEQQFDTVSIEFVAHKRD